ncbi:NAD kinase [Paenisporosarcina antarctica]|uniref:NAD kinase n=1 Tax=Paenisporosarcina antarctica TaxID=417367 RepID=A0A4P6ZWA6_9BACL|nr:NAD kinase [Paenisporosarcina antarctica]QBP40652.1 NAD kinase [Paenisporosarcina antarctica]
MSERTHIYIYTKHDEKSLEKKMILTEMFSKYGFTAVDDAQNSNIIISLGGDGAFLQAVRKTGFRQDCLYAGISTTGTLSMYCDFYFHEMETMIQAVLRSEIEIRRYPILQVIVDNNPPFYCLNEFSIRSNIIKTFVLDVVIDNLHFETFRGDGMIISTPTGSTAYNKSVNGAVVDPLLPCFQVSELASVNSNTYRSLGSSFILSGQRQLTLRLKQDGNDFPTMAMDNESLSIKHVESVNITLSDRLVKTVKLKNNSFWEKVKRTYL